MWSIGKIITRIIKKKRTSLSALICVSLLALAVQCSPISEIEAGRVERKILLGAASFSFSNSCTADILVFNDDRLQKLDSYQRMKIKNGCVNAVTTGGPKLIAVIVNSGRERDEWAAIDSYAALEKLRAELRNEDPDNPLMTGTARTGGKSDGSCTISLEPLLSEVVLSSICCDFAGKPYEGETLQEAKAYLTNVSASCKIMGSSWDSVAEMVNTAGLNASDLSSLQFPGMLTSALPSSIGDEPVQLDTQMWCYPNTCSEETLGSHFTRLVIEGKIRGITYWWPIDINREDFGPVQGTAGISRNCRYVIDLTLTRTGSYDPDIPVSAADVRCKLQLQQWKDMDETIETY